MDRSALKLFKSCSNIKWVCNDCLKTNPLYLPRENTPAFSEKIKAEIKSAVEPFLSVAKTMQELMPKVMELVSQKPSYKESLDLKSNDEFPPMDQKNPRKRGRTPDREKNDNEPNYGALFRDKLVYGQADSSSSNITGVRARARTAPAASLSDVNTRKIFVSRLKPTTSCTDIIEHLVSKKMIAEANDIYCTKLVKKDAKLDELSFVSFKLDVPEHLFAAISNPLMWPDSVAIREFVDTPARPRAVATIKRPRDTSQSRSMDIDQMIVPTSPQALSNGAGEGTAEPIELDNTLNNTLNDILNETSKN